MVVLQQTYLTCSVSCYKPEHLLGQGGHMLRSMDQLSLTRLHLSVAWPHDHRRYQRVQYMLLWEQHHLLIAYTLFKLPKVNHKR